MLPIKSSVALARKLPNCCEASTNPTSLIINADKVRLTGNKWNDRVYLRYSGYPGGQYEFSPAELMARPRGAERLVKKVVKGMLPKNKLGARQLDNLFVYEGAEHPHQAQNPKAIDINTLK